jgi:hypothetical protein
LPDFVLTTENARASGLGVSFVWVFGCRQSP